MPIIYQSIVKRAGLRANPEACYLFGDFDYERIKPRLQLLIHVRIDGLVREGQTIVVPLDGFGVYDIDVTGNHAPPKR